MSITTSFTSFQSQRLAVKLSPKAERYVLKGHPWIFSNSIKKINKSPQTGDLAIIFGSSDNKLIGLGLYDAESDISIKMLYQGSRPTTIDADFFKNNINKAYQKRFALLETDTNSYRLLFGESDGFPGLIADVYDNVLVIKLYSEIWWPYLDLFLNQLIETSNVDAVVLRLNRKLQLSKRHKYKDGDVIYGTLTNEIVLFKEHGVRFSANVIKGHKTGYFLDHRNNRKTVGELSSGSTVLDVFSYAGGFSVHALANGATEVTSLDISAQALEVAKYNVSLNHHSGKHHIIIGDAFKSLRQLIADHRQYNVVVIDPPSFAKQQSEVNLAKKKYYQLAQLGAQLTKKGGWLVLASCSSRITKDVFHQVCSEALKDLRIKFQMMFSTQHDDDHPIGFPEAAYLKCIYFKIL